MMEVLIKHEMNSNELCFQSYDYPASMSGRFNGVQRKIHDKLGRRIPYMPVLSASFKHNNRAQLPGKPCRTGPVQCP